MRKDGSGFDGDDIDDYILEFWSNTFNCSWTIANDTKVKACTGLEELQGVETVFTDVSYLRFTYKVYLAVYSVAHSLHNLQTCTPSNGPFENGSCANVGSFKVWQVNHYHVLHIFTSTTEGGWRLCFHPNLFVSLSVYL